MHRILADLVVVLHFGFVLFAVLGGFLAFKWRRILWLHLPTVLWAALIEFCGWPCPLTPLENWLRMKAGSLGYQTDFIAHYILPVLYPANLTRGMQIALGVLVLGVNIGIYTRLLISKADEIRN